MRHQQDGESGAIAQPFDQRHDLLAPPVEQLVDAEQRSRLGQARVIGRTVEQVGANAQMREQPRLLEDITRAAPLGRQVDPRRGIEQRLPADADMPRIGAQQPGDH
eukprot:gene11422-15277_t